MEDFSGTEEGQQVSGIVQAIGECLEQVISLPWIRGTRETNRVEDLWSSVRAVVGDAETQKLCLDSAKAPLLQLQQRLRIPSHMLMHVLSLSQSQQRCSCSCSSLLRSCLPLKLIRRAFVQAIASALETLRHDPQWSRLETLILERIKTVNLSTGNRGTSYATGREGDKNYIVQLLLTPCAEPAVQRVPVVSLFGAKGLGKSNLAKAIFDDGSIVKEFESLRLWVNAGGADFDLKNVVQAIVECIVGDRTEDLPLGALKDLLGKLISKKKFLLVLDDYLSEEENEWNELMECLKGGEVGTRMIVVTPNESVADRITTLSKYELKGLSVNDSLSLWDLVVPEGVKPSEFEKLKEDIVSKCGPNPLSVEVIGKVVRYRLPETELLQFMKDVLGKLEGSNSPALELGFSYLPPQLQKCFLYCGLFPRGENIDVERLIHQWMAHQYIIRPDGAKESVEEIGLEYFKYLVKRSFLIEGAKDELQNVTTCKLDDSMHELATKLAGESGHKVVKGPKQNEKMEDFNDISTRHVSLPFHFNSKLTDKCSFHAQCLRTFLLPRQDILKSNEGQFRNSFSRDMLTKFKHLYVCDLHSSGIAKVPSCIQNLGCLRYLDISDNDEIKSLPDAITWLRHLLVLNVTGCEMLEELPRNIRRLTKLRHLYCHRCWNLKFMPSGIGALTELRTLSWFVVAEDSSLFAHIGGLEELGGLQHLREVEIRDLKHLKGGDSEFQRAELKKKEHLQSMTLHWNHDEDDEGGEIADPKFDLDMHLNEHLRRLELRDYKGQDFPLKFTSLVNLVHISLENCAMCKTIPPLEHIKTLESLSVENFPCLLYIEYDEKNKHANAPLFQSLKKLSLSNCPNLMGWSTEEKEKESETSLPVLGIECFQSILLAEIKDCPKFKPEFLKAEDKPATGNPGIDRRELSHILLQNVKLRKRNVRRTAAIIRDMVQNAPENAKAPIKWGTSVIVQDVESFPEELLMNMSCFQKLHISNCPKLLSLPEALKKCTTLQELEISGCPRLEARVGNENGADWPLVAHIPYIRINSEYVKWEGQLQLNPKASVPGVQHLLQGD